MIRRTLLVGAVLTAALAPAAQARPSLVVEAVAKGHHGGFEQMAVQFECGAIDVTGKVPDLQRCTFGPLYASTGGCVECIDPPVTTGSGTVRLGMPYDLCVTASTYSAAGTVTVSRCAPYSYLTNTAVIAG